MITHLKIKDFALFESLELSLADGLSVFTGESGAGKSLIFDALASLFGGRCSTANIRQGKERYSLQAVLSLTGQNLAKDYLMEQGFRYTGDEIIITKELMKDGKARVKIGESLASTTHLRELGKTMAEIHSQNEQLFLLEKSNQLEFLDRFGNLESLKSKFKSALQQYRHWKQKLNDFEETRRTMLKRKARELSGVQIGVALGGGAALGLAQVGIMKVMEEEGLVPDMIAGTSIGAVIGAFWASGLGYKGILPLLAEIDSIFKMFKLVDLSFPGQGLLHGKHVRALLEKYLGDLYFEDLPIKLRLISCDISTRQEIVLSEGKVLDAVMASISIPGVFVPQPQENGKTYVDGGIVNPLPVSALSHEGVEKIIAINSMPSSKDEMKTNKLLNLNVLDIIVNSLYSLQYRIGKYSAQEADVYLNPILPNSNWFEFWRSAEFIQLGETVTKSSLEEIKQLFSEKS